MGALAITGVRIWDGVGDAREEAPATIRIEEGRIAAIGRAPELTRDAEVHAADAEDATALPGLIDAHVHLSLDPATLDPRKQFEAPLELRREAMCARAGAMLRAGITTARDLGGGEWLELELRARIERGESPGPRLLCAGQPLTAPGGHCHFWGGEVRNDDEARDAIQRQVEHGVDWIKVMATGGVMTAGTKITEAQFDAEQLAHIVAEARGHGRMVAAHCHGTAGIRNATQAGVRTIEHCSFAGATGFGSDFDPALAERMAAREELWISPTVSAGWGRRREKDGRPTEFALRMRECFARLRDAGVAFIASTDAGIPGVAHDRLPHALAVFADYAGLSPLRALRSATSEAARALGLEGHTGVLRPGLCADVLVVDGNPLRDLAQLTTPRLVVAQGRVAAPTGGAD